MSDKNSTADKIANWVEKKPLIMIHLDKEISEKLLESKRGFEFLTLVQPHDVFHEFKLPTPCLIQTHEYDKPRCYLGTVTRKASISTFDSRLTIKRLRSITPSSFKAVQDIVTNNRLIHLTDFPLKGGFSKLSPKLSAHIIHQLPQTTKNHNALKAVLSQLPGLRCVSDINWSQEDAIHTAMEVFGISTSEPAQEVYLVNGKSSSLDLIGTYLYEDNVIHSDASQLPGFDLIGPNITGRAVFKKQNEQLIVYTANKLPLEKMLGVDLIYINEIKGNIVMVQYKMLEGAKSSSANSDWLYRPDKQLYAEIGRMQLPSYKDDRTDYRLNSNPFYFKFIKRKVLDKSPQSFFIHLDHLTQILKSPEAKGSRGGVRISYDTLNGTYLREQDMIRLIRSGYIGTHKEYSVLLKEVIDRVSKGDKALVLAWQKKIDFDRDKP